MDRRARIGYLVKAFPVVSETFILNEVRAMERQAVPLALLCLKSPPPAVVHASVAEVTSPVEVASWHRPLRWPALFLDHLQISASARGAYWRTLRRSVGRELGNFLKSPSRRHWTLLRKHLRRFNWAVWAARRAESLAIGHFHAHYAGEPLRVAHLVKKLIGTPYSFTAHAKDLYLAPERRLVRRLATAEFAVGCHRHGVETLRSYLPESEHDKVRHIRHGIDLGLFARVASSRRPENGRLLAVGRLTEKKGFEDLIEACALLATKRPDLRCDLVGDGRTRPKLEALIARHGLTDQVRIHGFVPQDELPDWYARACVAVLPSKVLADGNRDGVPNVLLEAMASGTAVVAADGAGIREWIEDGVTGLLTPSEDPAALAARLESLLTDPSTAGRLGRAAAERVRDLDFEHTNVELAARFRSILTKPVDAALAAADADAWAGKGLARKAGKVLGIKPRRRPEVEEGIRRAVRPGIEANAWRPDLVQLAGRRLWDEAIKGNRLHRLLPLLTGGRTDRRVLDLGSGRGGLTVALQARGVSTTAIDLRFRNCAVTRLRARRYGLGNRAITSIAERLPLADSLFDAVACLEVLEHVGDPVALLREVRRVLKPDGRCVVTVINRWSHFDPHYHLWGINFLPRSLANRYIDWRRRTKRSYRDRQTLDEMHYFTYRSFVRLAGELGFNVVPPPPEGGRWRRLRHTASLALSLGFNTITVVLEPQPVAAPSTAPLPRLRPSAIPTASPAPPATFAGSRH